MIGDLNGIIYCIEIQTERERADSRRFVWSYDRDMISRFLMQHNIDAASVKWYVFLKEDFNQYKKMLEPEYELSVFHMKSFRDNKVYSVVSSLDFISDALEDVCEALCDALMLGPCSLRCEIEVFRKIVDIIDEIPYAHVYDCDIADVPTENDWDEHYTYSDDGEMKNNMDLSITYDPMYDKMRGTGLQPITLESYIRSFTQALIREETRHGHEERYIHV